MKLPGDFLLSSNRIVACMIQKKSGFREHEHTADWELEVWAPDLAGLLEQAARGMYSLSATRLKSKPRLERNIQFSAYDSETLVVTFLQELLFLGEVEGIGFDTFTVHVKDLEVNAILGGAPIDSRMKEIKAVTYHNISVTQNDEGVKVRIVFDV
jgi:SHS2 domain-containing protein